MATSQSNNDTSLFDDLALEYDAWFDKEGSAEELQPDRVVVTNPGG